MSLDWDFWLSRARKFLEFLEIPGREFSAKKNRIFRLNQKIRLGGGFLVNFKIYTKDISNLRSRA